MLPATAVALAVLAALLAWPVPAALARAGWPRRDPLTALLCWQAVGLAGLFEDHPLSSTIADLTVYLRQPAPDAQAMRVGRAAAEGALVPSL